MITINLMEASVMPLALSDHVEEIAEEALQAAFKTIADGCERHGFPVTGDFAPDEVHSLGEAFKGFVLAMALNNPRVAEMQDSV